MINSHVIPEAPTKNHKKGRQSHFVPNNVKLNYLYYIAMLETICEQLEQLVFDSNTWNYLTVANRIVIVW